MGERCYTEKGFSKEYGVSELTISKRIAEYYKKERKEKPKKEMKKIELPIEEIVEKWEKGAIQEELSKEYGVSSSTINKMISEHYEMKRNNERRFKVLKSSVVIVEYLRKGLTIEQIESIALKQHIIVPQKVIEKANQKIEQLKANEKTGRKMINLPIEEIVKKWEKGATYKELSKEYGVSLSTIKYRISKYYEKEGKEKPKRQSKQRINLPIEEIVKKWEKGAIQRDLSKEYGASRYTINKKISKYYEKEGKEKPKRRVELPIEEIVEKWEKSATYEELSKEFNGVIKKYPKVEKPLKAVKKISFSNLVLIIALPFSPAFLINIACGLSKTDFKKFITAILIGKLSIIYFWGFVSKSLLESITDIKTLIIIGILLIVSYALSKIVNKKLKFE